MIVDLASISEKCPNGNGRKVEVWVVWSDNTLRFEAVYGVGLIADADNKLVRNINEVARIRGAPMKNISNDEYVFMNI